MSISEEWMKKMWYIYCCSYSVSLSCLTLPTPWNAALQAFPSFTISLSLLKLMSIESVIPFNHLIFCCLLLFLPSIFPSIRVFSKSQLFPSGGQCIVASASASVLPMNIQSSFLLRLTDLIPLLSKGLSRIFYSTKIQKYQFLFNRAHLFTKAAVINYLGHCGLKQRTFILLHFWRPELLRQNPWAMIKVSAGPCSSQRLWRWHPLPYLLLLMRAAIPPWLVTASFLSLRLEPSDLLCLHIAFPSLCV